MKRLSMLAGIMVTVSSAAHGDPPRDGDRDRSEPTFSERTLRAFDRTGRYAVIHKNADGSETVHYHGSHQMVMMARIGEDGRIETFCAGDEAAARAFVEGAADVGNREEPR